MHHWVGIWKHKATNKCLVITDKHYKWSSKYCKDIFGFSRETLRSMDGSASFYGSKPLVYPQLVEWDYESTSNGKSS